MKIGVITEIEKDETRVALTPESAQNIQKLGHEVFMQAGAGAKSDFSDNQYKDVGVSIHKTAKAVADACDVIIKLRPPTGDETKLLKKGHTLISFFYPGEKKEMMEALAKKGVTVIAMDMVPRISRAQKMDALSSMANIAGYRSVIEASNVFERFFAGQITAAGKVQPARVLVIGAGVAGLAAIGTAVSLGAIVTAFDVRPEVADQVKSMGADFLFLDFDNTEQDGAATGGYAAPSSPEFREKQLEAFRKVAPEMDIVITTALIPGRDAPKLWLKDMVDAMKPGSVVVDLAAERGGNCDLTKAGKKITSKNGVNIIGYTDLPARMGAQASSLYASNIRHMLADLTPEKDGVINHNMEDDVIRGATIAHEGAVTFPPPPPKVKAIAAQAKAPEEPELTPEQKAALAAKEHRKVTIRQAGLLTVGGLFMLLIGQYAPASFMQHFIVFALACFVGFQVIWNVNHALHTPLMAVTNAISGIIIVGALLQLGSSHTIAVILAAISVLIATINIVGGFLVTHRMLQMFKKS